MMVHITPTMLWATYCIGCSISTFLIFGLFKRCSLRYGVAAVALSFLWPLIIVLIMVIWCAVVIVCIGEKVFDFIDRRR